MSIKNAKVLNEIPTATLHSYFSGKNKDQYRCRVTLNSSAVKKFDLERFAKAVYEYNKEARILSIRFYKIREEYPYHAYSLQRTHIGCSRLQIGAVSFVRAFKLEKLFNNGKNNKYRVSFDKEKNILVVDLMDKVRKIYAGSNKPYGVK